MKEKIESISKEIEERLKKIKDNNSLNEIRNDYFGKKGKITELNSLLKDLTDSEKKEFGKRF